MYSRTNDLIIPALSSRQSRQAVTDVSLPQEDHAYTLRLADGQRWDFCFARGLTRWGKFFTSIMNLGPAGIHRGRALVFVDPPEGDASVSDHPQKIEHAALPTVQDKHSWSAQDPGPVRIWRTDRASRVVVEPRFHTNPELETISMLFSLIPVYQAVISNGGIPFHAALVTRSGAGVLIAAKGDGGKSKCAARIPKPWNALCDDETVIVRDTTGRYVVHPFPTWSDCISGRSDRTWDVQHYVPLQAIFFLEQAAEDEVIEVSSAQAATRAYKATEQISVQTLRGLQPSDVRAIRHRLFENACDLVNAVPTYVLRASLDGKFWEEMERVLPCAGKDHCT